MRRGIASTALPKTRAGGAAGEGEGCVRHGCEADLVCHELFGTCQPPAEQAGATCGGERHCRLDLDLVCVTGACRLLGQAGDICKEDLHCGRGLVCNASTTRMACQAPGAAGDACARDLDCAADHHCSSVGRCVHDALEGESCAYTTPCISGLVCNAALDPPVCLPPGRSGEPCAFEADCETALRCNAAHDPPQCRPPGDSGAACAFDSDCAPGLRRNTGYAPPRCLLPSSIPGTPCTSNDHCANALYCTDTGACRRLGREGDTCVSDEHCLGAFVCNTAFSPAECRPWGRPDDLCATGYHESRGHHDHTRGTCGPDLVCNAAHSPQRCRPPGEQGEPCTKTADCRAGLLCNPSTRPGQCLPPGGEDAPCVSDVHCETGLQCNTAVQPPACLLPGEAGDPCIVDAHCGAGMLCNTAYTSAQCHPPSTIPGTPCVVDAHCGGGQLCNRAYDPPECQPPATEVDKPCSDAEHCAEPLYCAPDGACRAGAEGDLCYDRCVEGLICNHGYKHFGKLRKPQCATPGEGGDTCLEAIECVVPAGQAHHMACVGGACLEGWVAELLEPEQSERSSSGEERGYLSISRDGTVEGTTCSGSSFFTSRFGGFDTHETGVSGCDVFFAAVDDLSVAHLLAVENKQVVHAHGLLTISEGAWPSEKPLPDLSLSSGLDDAGATAQPDGALHLALHAGGKLWYATNASGGWVTDMVDDAGGRAPAIAVTVGGVAHVVYGGNVDGKRVVRYATRNAEGWSLETVSKKSTSSSTNLRGAHTLALDGDLLPHVLLYERSSDDAYYYRRTESGWEGGDVPGSLRDSDAGKPKALAVDGSGNAHIVALNDGGDGRVDVVHWSAELSRDGYPRQAVLRRLRSY